MLQRLVGLMCLPLIRTIALTLNPLLWISETERDRKTRHSFFTGLKREADFFFNKAFLLETALEILKPERIKKLY